MGIRDVLREDSLARWQASSDDRSYKVVSRTDPRFCTPEDVEDACELVAIYDSEIKMHDTRNHIPFYIRLCVTLATAYAIALGSFKVFQEINRFMDPISSFLGTLVLTLIVAFLSICLENEIWQSIGKALLRRRIKALKHWLALANQR